MKIIKAFLLVSTLVSVSFSIKISGTVIESGGTAIEGAIVKLEGNKLIDTTETDGSFILTDVIGINNHINYFFSHNLSVSINKGLMYINIEERSYLEIVTYTLHGKLLCSIKRVMSPGTHTITLPHTGAGVYIHSVKSGSIEFVLKECSIEALSYGKSEAGYGSSYQCLVKNSRKRELFDDTIKVTKPGYLNKRISVTDSNTSGMVIELINQDAGTVTDIDGNVYNAIRIGNQIWTVENLRTTKYNDGTPISKITSDSLWGKDNSGAYCYYNNDSVANAVKYGALYNWHAVNTGKLAPAGWHVPADAEWDTLQNYLIANGYNWDGSTSGNKIAKAMATKTDWIKHLLPGSIGCDLTINNHSGFSALPGGYRSSVGNFSLKSYDGYWWSTTENNVSTAYGRFLKYNYIDLYVFSGIKEFGFYVRLVKD
jgi:uncharacterized protein (TIGR02145 family)